MEGRGLRNKHKQISTYANKNKILCTAKPQLPLGTPFFGPSLRKFTFRLREMSMWFGGQNSIRPKQRAQQAGSGFLSALQPWSVNIVYIFYMFFGYRT